jgi:phage-related holin
MTFISTYFYNLTLDHVEQYLALIAVVLFDGFFGIVAGVKREGFQTFKALKVLRTTVTWIVILTVLLLVEKGFPGTGWLSETILVPFIVFELLSALKNASMAGFIQADILNKILDKFDTHKGDRQ